MDWGRVARNVERLILSQRGLTVDYTYRGKVHTAVRTTLRREDINSDAGLVGVYSFSLLCPYSDLVGAMPVPRTDKIVMDGTPYRVLAVEVDSAQATVRMHVGDINS